MNNILHEAYYKSAVLNEENLRFWENYLQDLKNLDFSLFNDKLTVPTLVPIGSRILFRGELKHTNEVTVALGADYFVKCSVKQAEILRQHRIKGAQNKVNEYSREKEYLEKQMSFTKENVFDNYGQEIVEHYNEEEDRAWRQKHRENVRKYKQNKTKENTQPEDVPDEELWNRLEELELQEELENELANLEDDIQNMQPKEPKLAPIEKENVGDTKLNQDNKKETNKKVTFKETEIPETNLKSDLLQQVIDKQNELEEKLYELKNRDRSETKTEKDLMSRLDELEQLEELEDEMDRLDDIIENEDVEEVDDDDEDSVKTKATKLQRRVSFVDDDDSETLELHFKHSPIESSGEPYDPKKGIQKPSDIYEAHSNLFGNSTTSILKKSKYEAVNIAPDTNTPKVKKDVHFDQHSDQEHETIVVKDVVEKLSHTDPNVLSQARPTSLFKKKRMQSKK